MTITARFKTTRQDFTLDIDLNLPGKCVTAIYGPSGCGKTTLLRAIAGLDKCDYGFLQVGNTVWQDNSTFVPPHKRPIGYVFQEANLFSHLNVKRNIEYGVKRVPVSERKVSLDNAIELLGIGHLLNRNSNQLSGGEKQRVAIARALSVSPKILLMDEPLSALDQARKQEIIPYLENLHDELDIPVLYVSHSPDEVARMADHLILLEQGKLQGMGAIGEMLTRLDLPLAHGNDAEALIEGTVVGHDEEYALTYVDFTGGRFTVTHKALPIGHPVRIRVTARDVSLTQEHQTGTSILNIFPATVDKMTPLGSAQMMVRLLVGGEPMLSRVTRKSVAVLELEPGKHIYAQAKSVALLS